MPLDPSGCASALADASTKRAEGNFSADFAKIYNDYVMDGIVLGALNEGGQKALIQAAISSMSSSAKDGSAKLAKGLAGYWATVAIMPDSPAHGGVSVAGVVNNAAALEGAFKGAIDSVLNPNQNGQPYYFKLISSIEAVVKTIIWQVTEVMPPPASPSTFPEVIQ